MMEFDETLSEVGQDRREHILRVTIRASRARRWRRNALRGAVMVFLLAMVAAPFLHRSALRDSSVTMQRESRDLSNPSLIPIEQIPTDPTIADRLSIRPDPHWQQISDDDLLQTLAAAGTPGGLVHVDGQTILVTDNENQ